MLQRQRVEPLTLKQHSDVSALKMTLVLHLRRRELLGWGAHAVRHGNRGPRGRGQQRRDG